ncbi:hypothetical protein [Bifidobacterium samirii]|uniref:Uncharacterized protein n=1 Tax=Bifidobacterium samirii TaxID=2306974 RepID=A0A430FUF7_9BIFI|nr:hypothetical protein [Bifidobacterium samirii]RSX56937.1 hypothetical protein D2E24_0882 [Bifidobacterium samirii]
MTNDIEHEHTSDTDSDATGARQPVEHIGDGEAGHAVLAYLWRGFARYGSGGMHESDYRLIMDDDQWMMVRDLLQRYLAMDDLDDAVRAIRDREMQRLADSSQTDTEPEPTPPGLPQGWWTLLEAAYERLGDEEGLRRIYMCYIVTNRLPRPRKSPEATGLGLVIDPMHYVRKLKTLSGEHWSEDVRCMVRVHQRHYRDPMFAGWQLSYEALLRSERLSDAAWRYCRVRCLSRYASADEAVGLMSTMFDVVAERHAEEVCNLLLDSLRDADSPMLCEDSPERVEQVIAVLRKCLPYDADRVHAECERLHGMYRRRRQLRSALEALMGGWTQPMGPPVTCMPRHDYRLR